MAVRYYDLIRDMTNPFNIVFCLVAYARQKGLLQRSRVLHSCPHKIQGELEEQVVALRRRNYLPSFSSKNFDMIFSASVVSGK